MRILNLLVASCAVAATFQCVPAMAGPGDVFVPAHRTRDGTYVPANVPTTSGGTHASPRPRRVAAGPARSSERIASVPPIFIEARPILK